MSSLHLLRIKGNTQKGLRLQTSAASWYSFVENERQKLSKETCNSIGNITLNIKGFCLRFCRKFSYLCYNSLTDANINRIAND